MTEMNRLKFRVWCVAERRMLDWENFSLDIMYAIHEQSPLFPVMYFTGLKEINGDDVYEHDIIRHKGQLYIIRWNNDVGGYIWEGHYKKDQYYWPFDCDVACECCIVGNMYENPELIP